MILDLEYNGALVIASYVEFDDAIDFDILRVDVADPVEACVELGTCDRTALDRIVRESRRRAALILRASQEWKRQHEYAAEPIGHP